MRFSKKKNAVVVTSNIYIVKPTRPNKLYDASHNNMYVLLVSLNNDELLKKQFILLHKFC